MSILSEKVLKETTVYLGPASKMFLERQTKAHLGGLVFDNLEKQHLAELGRWMELSAGMLIPKDKAKELADKIRAM